MFTQCVWLSLCPFLNHYTLSVVPNKAVSAFNSFHSSDENSFGDLHATQPNWFALGVRPRSEKRVERLFLRDGIEVFLPTREKAVKHQKQRPKLTRLPLLPSFIFVRIVRKQLTQVLATPGVNKIVRIGTEYRKVTDKEMELLRRISSYQGAELEPGPREEPAELQTGALVEIINGSLASQQGVFVKQKNNVAIIEMLLGSVNTPLRVEVDSRNLQVLNQDGPAPNDY